MTDLEKYEAVNKCETLEELAECILSFANKGLIKGRTKIFNAGMMAAACRQYDLTFHSTLTREFGIRQQAMMILFYNR